MSDTREYISNLDMPEKISLFKELYNELAGYGIEGDTELAHVNTFEASLLKSLGGSGTLNEITGFREYKGGGSAPPPPAVQTVTQQTEFPTELKPFISDILGEGRAEFGREKAEGFQPFPGPQIAGFTPEQQAAFAAGREQFTGLAGTPLGQAATYYAPALAATALGTAEIGAEDIGRRMDPFLQNVVDIAKREARRDEEAAVQGRAAQAVGAGSFGGTRQGLVEAEAERNLAERLGDIQARGLSVSFQQAQQAAEQQRQRELGGGRQFAALGDVTGQRARADVAGLAGIGETQQQRNQQALDIARQEFLQEQQFPAATLQKYASLVRGFPYTMGGTSVQKTTVPTPSLAQTLTGGAATAAGLYGMFGGFKPGREGGLVSLQGGGIPQVPVGSQRRVPMQGGSQIPVGAQRMIPMLMNMYNANPAFKAKIDQMIQKQQQPQMTQSGYNMGMQGADPNLSMVGGMNQGGLVSLWHGGPPEEHRSSQRDWFDPDMYLRQAGDEPSGSRWHMGLNLGGDELDPTITVPPRKPTPPNGGDAVLEGGEGEDLGGGSDIDYSGIKSLYNIDYSGRTALGKFVEERVDPSRQAVMEEIGKVPYEEIVRQRREHYDDQAIIAQERKMQALYTSLIAGGAGILSADPQKGYAASLGEGIKTALPVAAAGLEDFYEATEKAKELERGEQIEERTYNLQNLLQEYQLEKDTLSDRTYWDNKLHKN